MNKAMAKKKYWATVPKEERSKRLQKVALIKSSKMTKGEKRLQHLVMKKGKELKKAYANNR